MINVFSKIHSNWSKATDLRHTSRDADILIVVIMIT